LPKRPEYTTFGSDLFQDSPIVTEQKPHHLGHRQRLRERFMAGPEALPDYEILELLLFYAVPQKDVKPIAKAMLARFGSMAGVLAADPEQLKEFDLIKDSAVALLKAVRQAGILAAREHAFSAGRTVLSSWDALLDYCRTRFAGLTHEQFHLLFLDRKNGLIADETQQKGTIDHTPVYPREIVKRALALESSAVIMVHNHPSGDPTPSRADIDMTRQVQAALKAVGIALHDHLVIGRAGHVSFKAQGLM
jgi:DNA repair protein RadC